MWNAGSFGLSKYIPVPQLGWTVRSCSHKIVLHVVGSPSVQTEPSWTAHWHSTFASHSWVHMSGSQTGLQKIATSMYTAKKYWHYEYHKHADKEISQESGGGSSACCIKMQRSSWQECALSGMEPSDTNNLVWWSWGGSPSMTIIVMSVKKKVKLSRYRPEQTHGDPVG
jgi:hypothetical protein